MSRYDGLIIPRSYNEYINKTDPVAMSQALQLNNVLAQEVAAGNNKAVKSSAVNNALNEYINKTDAATLQQALQLPGVLSEAVAAGDNKAVKSSAVNNALANYPTKTDLQTVTSREEKTNGVLIFRKSGNIVQLRTSVTMNLTAGIWNEIATISDANLRPKTVIDSIVVDNSHDLPLHARYNVTGIIQVAPVNTIRQYNNTEVNIIGDITYLV